MSVIWPSPVVAENWKIEKIGESGTKPVNGKYFSVHDLLPHPATAREIT